VAFEIRELAEHSEEVNRVLMKEIVVSKIELDELWTSSCHLSITVLSPGPSRPDGPRQDR
jgi:hypothetical protein